MESKIQCPVCTLFLHEGMSLDVHLDTHPKDQVIRALCALSSGNRASFGELSFQSEEGRRPPSRAPSRFSSRASRSSSRASSVAPSAYGRSRSRSPYAKEYRECREGRDCRDCRCRPTPPPPPPVYPSVSVQVSTTPNPGQGAPPFQNAAAPAPLPAVETVALAPPPGSLGPLGFVLPGSQPFDGAAKNIFIASLPLNRPKAKSPGPGQRAPAFEPPPRGPPQIVYRKVVGDGDVDGYLAGARGPLDPPEGAVSGPVTSFRNVMVLQPYPKTCFVQQQRAFAPKTEGSFAFGLPAGALRFQGFGDAAPRVFPADQPPGFQDPKRPPGQGSDRKPAIETAGRLSGLRILSDVKIEPPMIADVIDLTLRSETMKKSLLLNMSRPNSNPEESILPDVDDSPDPYARNKFSNVYSVNGLLNTTLPVKDASSKIAEKETSNFNIVSNTSTNTFSVIKNVGNPTSFKPSVSSFLNNESSRSSLDLIVPDITCTEKPRTNFNEPSFADSSETPKLEISMNEIFNDVPMLNESIAATATLTKIPMKKNVYSRKPKKTLTIKNMKEKLKPLEDFNKPSSSITCENISEKNVTVAEENIDTELLDCDKTKNCNIPNPPHFLNNYLSPPEFKMEDNLNKKNILNSECNALDGQIFIDLPPIDRQNFSCDKNPFDNNEVSNIDKFFLSNLAKKSNDNSLDSNNVRPVNVIAFGSMAVPNEITKLETFTPFTDISKNVSNINHNIKIDDNHKDIVSTTDPTYANENSYSATSSQEKFSNANDNENDNHSVTSDNEITEKIHKIELPSIEDIPNANDQYLWNDTIQKDEFPFANLMQYNQSFQKIENCLDDRDQLNTIDKNYTELLCPHDNFSNQDNKSSFFNSLGKEKCTISNSDALNIRTDEQMPSRGELSEQESSGDMDAPWAGMYRDSATFSDVVGSTSYDFLAQDSWPSDPSDIDMPNSPRKSLYIQENDTENVPVVVSIKPPDKNYKCATCFKTFNCPKERRVHRSKEHPNNSNIKKIVKKTCFIPIQANIEKENSIKIESITPTATSNSSLLSATNNLDDSTKIDIKPVKTEFINCKDLDQIENKPPLSFVKVEVDKKKSDLTCSTCKAEFPNVFKYNEHLKIHPLECLTCGKLFHRRTNLQLHLKRHYGIKDYKCAVCEKRFITKQKMIEHYNIHTGKAPIKCNLCDLFFRRHSNMVQHRNRHHLQLKKKLRDYICACGEVFHSKKKLAWHKEIHDDKPKACLHCNEKFIHMSSLTRHIRRTHNNYFVPDEKRKDENVQCTECNNVYLKSSIDMHMKTHSGSKPYSCVICSKNFTTKWNLKLHKWTHANRSTKPFKCNQCKSAFIRQVDYVSHMNSHKSVRPYTCNYCGCQFIRKYNCQRHVKEHENEKKYVCEVPDCGKTFHRSYYLTEHLTVHSGVRPFSCNICGKTSSTKSNHNKHIKIHHAREPVTTEG